MEPQSLRKAKEYFAKFQQTLSLGNLEDALFYATETIDEHQGTSIAAVAIRFIQNYRRWWMPLAKKAISTKATRETLLQHLEISKAFLEHGPIDEEIRRELKRIGIDLLKIVFLELLPGSDHETREQIEERFRELYLELEASPEGERID